MTFHWVTVLFGRFSAELLAPPGEGEGRVGVGRVVTWTQFPEVIGGQWSTVSGHHHAEEGRGLLRADNTLITKQNPDIKRAMEFCIYDNMLKRNGRGLFVKREKGLQT